MLTNEDHLKKEKQLPLGRRTGKREPQLRKQAQKIGLRASLPCDFLINGCGPELYKKADRPSHEEQASEQPSSIFSLEFALTSLSDGA